MSKSNKAPVTDLLPPADAPPAEVPPAEVPPAEVPPADAPPADAPPADAPPAETEAFVLRDCGFGTAGEIVTLSAADAETGAQHGMLDLHPDAIKAARVK